MIPDQEFNERMVARDSKKDTVCMWSRVWHEANAGNVNVRASLPIQGQKGRVMDCLHDCTV